MTTIAYCLDNSTTYSSGWLNGIQVTIAAYYVDKTVNPIDLNAYGAMYGNCSEIEIAQDESIIIMSYSYDNVT